MFEFKRKLLCIALSSAVFAIGAQAQNAPATDNDDANSKKETPAERAKRLTREQQAKEMEAVVVTGIRRGIEGAITLKQQSTSIIEAVSAEDIGKLPDTSIAESLARLPGLTAQRVAGRASTISIRGLAGDFSSTLLNGREQVSIGDNRSVEFDQYPSELLGAVVVYKTPDAKLVGQGLAGTVDLRTVRPLSFPGRTVSLNVRAEKNSLGELNPGYSDKGSRVSASYIDQFADGTFGLAVGYARLDSPGQAQRWSAWGYTDTPVAGVPTRTLGGSESWSTSTDNVRDGLMMVMEYVPNDVYNTTLDVYYSQFDRAETTRALQFGIAFSGATLSNPTVVDGTIVAGRAVGVKPVIRNDQNDRDDSLFAIGWNNKFTFNDSWTGEADLSFSRADRSESILETYAGTANRATDTVNYTLGSNGRPPTLTFGLNYADPGIIQLIDSGGWGQDGYVKYPEVEDDLQSFRVSTTRSSTENYNTWEFGLNHAGREKSRGVAEAFLALRNSPTRVPDSLLNTPADLSFTGIPGVLSYDINDAFNQFYTTRANVNGDILNKDWTVDEKITTLYTQYNIDTEWGAIPVRGNFGLQAVHSEQSSEGFAVPGRDISLSVPIFGGATYTDYLPTLNLSFGLANEQSIRVGLGRQTARPRLDDMRATTRFDIDLTTRRWSANGGNPGLRPTKATAFDISYEKYFGTRAYISIAGFYKDLSTYIYNQNVDFDFSAFNPGNVVPVSNIGSFSRPVNGEGGSVRGAEFSLSLPFDMFSNALDGFGTIISYTRTNSSIEPNGPGSTQPLPGLSKNLGNITLYYERGPFSTRVSQRYRSDFLGEVQGFGADRTQVFIDDESIVDFQISYNFDIGGGEDNMTALFQVNNLNNERYREYFDQPELTKTYNEYGRTMLLGLTYRF